MRLRVLGCHGGESATHRAACFRVDDDILLDAGAVTRGLTLAEQGRIDHVLLTHAHLDHVHDLALLADNVIGARASPIEVYAGPETIDTLRQHLFNGKLWPDFTKLPSAEQPILRLHAVRPGETLTLGKYRVRSVPVSHTVECHGYIVTGEHGSLVYAGDTGPTEALWRAVNELPALRAIICETSFPNELEELARASGHLTPRLLSAELDKLASQTRAMVLLAHMKPRHVEVLKEQIAALGDPRLRMLKPMDELEL